MISNKELACFISLIPDSNWKQKDYLETKYAASSDRIKLKKGRTIKTNTFEKETQ